MAGQSGGASYCLCKDGLSELQKNINYACGPGADCSAINQGGSCFNPNTVKDHCNYAINSYFQKKGEATGSCDFSGTAITSSSPPVAVENRRLPIPFFGTTLIQCHSGSDQDAVKITITGSSVNGRSTSKTLSLGSSGRKDMHIGLFAVQKNKVKKRNQGQES